MVSDNSDYECFGCVRVFGSQRQLCRAHVHLEFCYKLNKQANDILATIPADTENQTLIYYRGQLWWRVRSPTSRLAQRFQFTYKGKRGQTDGYPS